MMDIEGIRKHLPHRYPFLFVDRVVAIEPGVSIEAYKNLSINEPYFDGHFPGNPVFPGVLLVEAMAQAAGILGFVTMGIFAATHHGVQGAIFQMLSHGWISGALFLCRGHL